MPLQPAAGAFSRPALCLVWVWQTPQSRRLPAVLAGRLALCCASPVWEARPHRAHASHHTALPVPAKPGCQGRPWGARRAPLPAVEAGAQRALCHPSANLGHGSLRTPHCRVYPPPAASPAAPQHRAHATVQRVNTRPRSLLGKCCTSRPGPTAPAESLRRALARAGARACAACRTRRARAWRRSQRNVARAAALVYNAVCSLGALPGAWGCASAGCGRNQQREEHARRSDSRQDEPCDRAAVAASSDGAGGPRGAAGSRRGGRWASCRPERCTARG